MLKIKNNVDLKELEKFGFDFVEADENGKNYFYIYEDIDEDNYLTVYKDQRIIKDSFDRSFMPADLIYALVQAGLVEKVEEGGIK